VVPKCLGHFGTRTLQWCRNIQWTLQHQCRNVSGPKCLYTHGTIPLFHIVESPAASNCSHWFIARVTFYVHTLWLYSFLVNLPTNQLAASQVADWWSHWLVNLSTTNSHGKTSLYLCINNPHHDPAANPNNKRLHKSLFSEKMKIHGVSE